MTAPSQIRPAQAASWPFDCLSFYSHMTRDFGRYAQALSQSTDAMEAARAEADFGVRVFGDLMHAYYDLAMAPWTAMASAMARQAADFPPFPVPLRTEPIRPEQGRTAQVRTGQLRTGKSRDQAAG